MDHGVDRAIESLLVDHGSIRSIDILTGIRSKLYDRIRSDRIDSMRLPGLAESTDRPMEHGIGIIPGGGIYRSTDGARDRNHRIAPRSINRATEQSSDQTGSISRNIRIVRHQLVDRIWIARSNRIILIGRHGRMMGGISRRDRIVPADHGSIRFDRSINITSANHSNLHDRIGSESESESNQIESDHRNQNRIESVR
jgi:hypothetical protein